MLSFIAAIFRILQCAKHRPKTEPHFHCRKGLMHKRQTQHFCVEYVCNYFRERYLGQVGPTKQINALGIEFGALSRHLPSVAPNRTTNSVLKNVKRKVRSSKYPSGAYLC